MVCSCSPSTVEQRRLADGSWQLTCMLPMDECVRRADDICSDQRYRVVRGRSRHVTLGALPSREDYRTSELTFVCGDDDGTLPDASALDAAQQAPDGGAPDAAPSAADSGG